MDNILDEQLEEQEILKPIPLVIYLLMAALFIFFLGSLFIIQSWPYGSLIQNIGTMCILVTGLFSIKLLIEKKDTYLNLYLGLFLFASFSKIVARFINYEARLTTLLSIGERFFIFAVLLILMRYFVLRRPKKTSLNFIKYPLLVTVPMWIVGIVFKMQSWPYASEILTVSVFVFLLGTIIMLILKLKREQPALLVINLWLVLMVNMFVFGMLFKIQSWPFASEMLNYSFLGGTLGLMFKLMQKQKLQKKQEQENIEG